MRRLIIALAILLLAMQAMAEEKFDATRPTTYNVANLKNPVSNLQAAIDAGNGQNAIETLGLEGVIDPTVRTTLLAAYANNNPPPTGAYADQFFRTSGNFVGQAAVNYMKNRQPSLTISEPATGQATLNPQTNTLTSRTGQTLTVSNLAAKTKITLNADGTFSVCAPGCAADATGTKLATRSPSTTTMAPMTTSKDGMLTIVAGPTDDPKKQQELIVDPSVTEVNALSTREDISFTGKTENGEFIAIPKDTMTIGSLETTGTTIIHMKEGDRLAVKGADGAWNSFAGDKTIVTFGKDSIETAGPTVIFSREGAARIAVKDNNPQDSEGTRILIGPRRGSTTDPSPSVFINTQDNTVTQTGGILTMTHSGHEPVESTVEKGAALFAVTSGEIVVTPQKGSKALFSTGGAEYDWNNGNIYLSSTSTYTPGTLSPTILNVKFDDSNILLQKGQVLAGPSAIPVAPTPPPVAPSTPPDKPVIALVIPLKEDSSLTALPTDSNDLQTRHQARLDTINNAIKEAEARRSWDPDAAGQLETLYAQKQEAVAAATAARTTVPADYVKPAPAPDQAARAQWERLANAIRDEKLRSGGDEYQIAQWERERADLAKKHTLTDLIGKNNAAGQDINLAQQRLRQLNDALKGPNAQSWMKSEAKQLTKYIEKLQKSAGKK